MEKEQGEEQGVIQERGKEETRIEEIQRKERWKNRRDRI